MPPRLVSPRTSYHQPHNCFLISRAAIADDFGITRISGLTWAQWNARLVAPKHEGDISLGGTSAATAIAPLPNHSLLYSSGESSRSPTSGATPTARGGGRLGDGDDNLHQHHHQTSFGSTGAVDYDDSSYSPGKMNLLAIGTGTPSNTSSGQMAANGGHGDFPCPDCGRMYKLKSSLRNHQKWECGKEPQFQCPFCAYRAKQKMHIGRHLERMHKDIVQMDLSKTPYLKELFMAGGVGDMKKGERKAKKIKSQPVETGSTTDQSMPMAAGSWMPIKRDIDDAMTTVDQSK